MVDVACNIFIKTDSQTSVPPSVAHPMLFCIKQGGGTITGQQIASWHAVLAVSASATKSISQLPQPVSQTANKSIRIQQKDRQGHFMHALIHTDLMHRLQMDVSCH